MSVSRRDFLRGASVLAGVGVLGPIVGRAGTAWGVAQVAPDAWERRRLVLIDLCGGNDGLNTVVPLDGTRRCQYVKARNATRVPIDDLHDLGPHGGEGRLGLHPAMPTLASLYDDLRVAIVQGVDYPDHNYSHFVSADIWQSGDPDNTPQSGWLGRHLDRTGIADGELRALAIGDGLPLALTGTDQQGSQLLSLPPAFPDVALPGSAAIHRAYKGYTGHPDTHPLRHRYGTVCGDASELVTSTAGMSIAAVAQQTPGIVKGMLGARELLLRDDLGVEIVSLKVGGFDTHSDQNTHHPALLRALDLALEAFFLGSQDGTPLTKGGSPIGALPAKVADRTIVMTFSEFGRRIGDNASGTDHGAAAPVFLVGPPAPVAGVPTLKHGLRTDHPDMGGTGTVPDNLAMTTDLRSVYQEILATWLSQPTDEEPYRDHGDPAFSGHGDLDLFD